MRSSPPGRTPLDLKALLIGVVLGFGTNLVTAEPAAWWGPLPLNERYAALWLPLAIGAVAGWEYARRRAERRRVPWTRSDSPYPGLEAYGADRAEVFFGREAETAEIVDRVSGGRAVAERWTTVVGPSGSGKSSLLAAGALPRLRGHHAVLGPMRPGALPFLALAQTLAADRSTADGPAAVEHLAAALRADAVAAAASPDGGHPAALAAALLSVQGRRARTVLALDQLEEVFRLVPEDERALFLGLLRAALRTHPQLHVLAALPTENLREAATGPHADLFRARVLLPPLGAVQTRAAITGPAKAAGVHIDAEVVELLAAEATAGNTLPLLGQLLRDLYESAPSGSGVGLELLAEKGPLAEAIGRHAEVAYARIAQAHPAETIDALLIEFVSWDERGCGRKVVAAGTLDGPRREIAEALRGARLLTETDSGDAFDLVHEAVLRHWPRLRDLIARHEEVLRLVTDLERRAAAWRSRGMSGDELLRGRSLTRAVDVTAGHSVSAAALDLVAASLRQERRESDARADALAVWAQQVHAAGDEPGLALALAATAVREYGATPASTLTLWGITRPPDTEHLAFGHAGKILALGWDRTSGTLRTIGEDGRIVTWTAEGDLAGQEAVGLGQLLKAGVGGGDAYWVAAQPPGPLEVRRFGDPGHLARTDDYGPNAVAVSRDGRWAAASFTGSGVGIVELAAAGGGPVAQWVLDGAGVSGLKWSPDATHLMVVEWDVLRVVRIADATTLWVLPRSGAGRLPEACVDWAPDGERVAMGSGELLHVVSARDGAVVAERGTAGPVSALSWSPDGRFIAVAESAAAGARMTVCDAATLAERHAPRVLDASADALAWSGDSAQLAWTSGGAAVILDVSSGRQCAPATGTLSDVSWDGDRVAAVVRGSGSVRMVRTGASPLPAQIMRAEDPRPVKVAWMPDGDLVAVSFKDRVELWDATRGTRTARLDPASNVPAVCAWSPDGTALATLGRDFWLSEPDRVEVWDPATGTRVAVMDADDRLCGVLAWSPGGSALAGVTKDGPLTVWNPRTGARTATVATATGTAVALCWSPDGRAVARLGQDSRMSVHEIASGDELVRTVRGGDGGANLAWSPDGRHLATTGIHWVRFWQAATGECLAVARTDAVMALDARWLDDRRFAVTGENHVRSVWTLPERSDALTCTSLLDAAGDDPRALTAEERGRFGVPVAED
ncbi:AAA family ATPase [Streptomyces aureocirculatus]|uniref:AAA family ATPase n=1 Tax=Streptomyces aureocirculatus TaxID=67275 RepID=UPI0004C71049|nr:AAA family ATPase [Streptomyces aureocirculatus]